MGVPVETISDFFPGDALDIARVHFVEAFVYLVLPGFLDIFTRQNVQTCDEGLCDACPIRLRLLEGIAQNFIRGCCRHVPSPPFHLPQEYQDAPGV